MSTVVARVQVETVADGSLLVTWALEGESVPVDVATGLTPDHLDHRHETTVPAGQSTLRLAGRPGVRQFVSVAPHGGGPAMVAADRRVGFQGITNFRDLGGYRARSGARVRWGQVFRADALHGLSQEDLALYGQLGLRAVYDLRGELERNERPNPVESRPLDILSRPTGADAPPPLPTGLTAEDGERILRDLYVGLIENAARRIGDLYGGLAEGDGLPAVFHCHAGKDRTGIVAALLLEALGVDRETILDDYELTSRYRLRVQQEGSYSRLLESGLAPEAAAGVLTTPRWAMQQALESLDRDHGGIDAYLIGPAGMGPGDVEALRQRLLDRAA